MSDEGILAVCSAVFIALLFGGLAWLESARCENKWERSGMRSEWRLVVGCLVELKDGTWIPAERYRALDQ